mgnify:CR=1 FL=1
MSQSPRQGWQGWHGIAGATGAAIGGLVDDATYAIEARRAASLTGSAVGAGAHATGTDAQRGGKGSTRS